MGGERGPTVMSNEVMRRYERPAVRALSARARVPPNWWNPEMTDGRLIGFQCGAMDPKRRPSAIVKDAVLKDR